MVQFDPNKIVELANTLVTGNPTGVASAVNEPVPTPAPAVPVAPPVAAPTVPAPTAPPAPVAPISQPTGYTVQAGDTASAIATRLGVPLANISGFRSGNPNLIFPGETLNVLKTPITAVPGGQPPQQPPTPAPAAPTAQPPAAPPAPGLMPESFETEVTGLLAKFGIKPPSPDQSPFTAFAETYKQLYSDLGLQTVKQRIESSTKSIEELEAKKNEEIAEVNDNPFVAANIRAGQKRKIENKYEAKINALVNRLKLDQSLFEQGQEDAQFVATKALSQSEQGQKLTQDIIFKAIDVAQKRAEAEAKLKEPQKPTSELQEYNFAVSQGFKGTSLDYKQAVAAAGRKPTSPSDDTFTNTQINIGAATAGMPIAEFKNLDADTKNFFINNSQEIKAKKKLIDEAKSKKEDPISLRTEIKNSSLPQAVKDSLDNYLKKVFPDIDKQEVSKPWWQRVANVFIPKGSEF